MRAIKILLVSIFYYISCLFSFAVAAPHTDYYPRPVPMGVSISTTPSSPTIFAGTAGMRVYSLDNPDNKFILSNNHVLGAIAPTLCPDSADLWPPPLTWALQPGTLDIGHDPGEDPFYQVGSVVRTVPIQFGRRGDNRVDAAIAYTTDEYTRSEILGIGEPNPELAEATVGMQLIKSGRTTGVTQGEVTAVNSTVRVNYGSGCGSAVFREQIMTSGNLGASGDSGSVVLDHDTLTPVGLYFAGSQSTGVMNPISEVYDRLGVFVDSANAPALSRNEYEARANNMQLDTEVTRLKSIQARHEARIMAIRGVVGVGISRPDNSQRPEFVVFCTKRTAQLLRELPRLLENTPVRVIESGEFVAH